MRSTGSFSTSGRRACAFALWEAEGQILSPNYFGGCRPPTPSPAHCLVLVEKPGAFKELSPLIFQEQPSQQCLGVFEKLEAAL